MGRKGGRTFVLIPSKCIWRLLRLKHDRSGHFGPAKTSALLRQSGYFWFDMERDIKLYCRSCIVCAKTKDPPQTWRAPLEETNQPMAPWQDVSVDLMGPFGRQVTARGNRYVLVALDLFTKGVELAAIQDKSAETVARALCDIVIYRHGIPESLLTDRGLEFDNKHMRLLADALGVDKKRISAFHPQANGAVERINQTLGSLLRRNAQEYEGSWDTQLGLVRFQYMSVPHSTTGLSPFFLTYGRHPRPLQAVKSETGHAGSRSEGTWAKKLVKELEKAHQAVLDREDQIRRQRIERSRPGAHFVKYEKGDKVFVKIPKKPGQPGKLQTRWDGPFVVVSCREGNTYRLKKDNDFRKRLLRHHDQMKPFQSREARLQSSEEPIAGQRNGSATGHTVRAWYSGTEDAHPAHEGDYVAADSDSETDLQVDDAEDEDDEPQEDEQAQPELPPPAEDPPPVPRRTARERRPPDRFGEWTQ